MLLLSFQRGIVYGVLGSPVFLRDFTDGLLGSSSFFDQPVDLFHQFFLIDFFFLLLFTFDKQDHLSLKIFQFT